MQDYAHSTATSKWQEHSAAANTHNRVSEMLAQHLPGMKGIKVCDLPCGSGALSARLSDLGLDVTPVDLERNQVFVFNPAKLVLADANYKLPFSDGEFDAMVSVEGIEHLENPSLFFRECARIVRPGGLVLLSTPNVDSFRSRRSMFAHGYFRYFRPVGPDTKMAHHLLPIDMTFVRGAAKRAALEIIEVGANNFADKTWLRSLLRPILTRKLPKEMRGEVPYYGQVVIYLMRKAAC